MSDTVRALADRYQAWAATYYRRADGSPTRTINNIRDAMRELTALHGETPAGEFKPLHLQETIQAMAASGRLKPRTINDRITWIRALFDWAARMEIVDSSLPLRLRTVKKLRSPRPRPKPVSRELVMETYQHAPRQLATMIEVHWWTGCRPGELVLMAKSNIDRSANPWVYRPPRHKSEHHGRTRTVLIGDMAQSELRTWLPHVAGDWIFPGRKPGEPYRCQSYYNAIRRINRAHGITPWHPHQIRHAFGTRIRRDAGLEAAQFLLGHADAKTTEIYAEPAAETAVDAINRYC